ncbi:MAG: hypothetical protein OEM38_12390 [Gammaproteobacteria bacterium]|nr:hypothetical protein [Gammaproteobacteria bacterium]
MLTLSFDAETKAIPELSHEDITKLKKTLSQSNPFTRQRTGLKHVTIDEKMANQSAQLFLSNYANIPLNIKLHEGHARISISPNIPKLPINLFANIAFNLSPNNNQITLSDAHIGHLPLPAFIFNLAYPLLKTRLTEQHPDYYRLLSSIERVTFSKQKVSINYRWDRRFSKQAQQFGKNFLLSKEEQKRIAIYYEQLSKIPRSYLRTPTSIHKIIQPLFLFAQQRIALGKNSTEENKAVLLTLGVFASGVRVNHLIKGENNKHLRHLYYGRLTLSGRSDLMRHFLISAALTASTSKALTNTIGLSKEMDDADGGSGFSFADLLADRAGVAFAKMAIDTDTATVFQDRITDNKSSATDFMPSHKDLPESISALEFKRNYIDTNNQKYLFVEKEIAERISSLPLHSPL